MYPGNIPAEPDKPRQDPDGTGRKTSQNRSKISSGRVRGASGIGPGRFRNTPERTKRPKIGKVSSKNRLVSLRSSFLPISGAGRKPKIAQKRARGRKRASGDGAGSGFYRFFLPLPFGVALRTDFGSIFHRKSRLNRESCFTQAPDSFRRGDLKDSV